MRVPEPAIYRRIGSSVRIDLGDIARHGPIEDGVKALDTKVQLVSDKIDQGTADLGSQMRSTSATLSGGIQAVIAEVQKLGPDIDAVAAVASSTFAEMQTLRGAMKQAVLDALDEHEDEEEVHDDFTERTLALAGQVTYLQLALLNPATAVDEFNALIEKVGEALKAFQREELVALLPDPWTLQPDLHLRSEDYWELEEIIEHLANDTVPVVVVEEVVIVEQAPSVQQQTAAEAAQSRPQIRRKAKTAAE